MKWYLIFLIAFSSQNVFSQFEITSITGFTFKQTKKEVMAQVKPKGKFIEESLLDEKSLGVKGLHLLGYPNDMVIFSFHNNQLYNIGITIVNKEEIGLNEIHDSLRKRMMEKYGKRFFVDGGTEFWLEEWGNPLCDKVIITSKPNEITIQFTHGRLMDLAHPEHRKNALKKARDRLL